VGWAARRAAAAPAGRLRGLLHVQFGADLVFLTVLLHFAGGAENPFAFFYCFLVVLSGILLGRRSSIAVTAAAIVLFAGMAGMERAGLAAHHHLGGAPACAAGGPPAPLPLTALLVAFTLTNLVLCYLVDVVVRALRASLARAGEENSRGRAVTESIQAGIVCFNEAGGVTSCNTAARRLYGCGNGESMGVCLADAVNGSTVRGLVRDILSGRRDSVVHEGARGDRILLNRFHPVVSPAGDRIGAVWVLVDLTEVRHLQMEALQHERSAVLAEIAAFVAHDIGNLLDGTLNGLRILEASASDPVACGRWVRELRMRLEQLPGVVRSLVDFSRQRVLQREPADVAEVVHRAVQMVAFRARQRGIRCEVAAAPTAPVTGDGIYLSLAVVNLLLNAFDAVQPGGRVAVRTRHSDGPEGNVEIEVGDDGCGIPPVDVDRIFEPFYTTKADRGGTGLGLTIVRRIVQEHGGSIRVSPRPGGGSVFVISLPAAREAALVGNDKQ
jgi:signal transduction histidine kinase